MRRPILAFIAFSWLAGCADGLQLPGFGGDRTGDGIRTLSLLNGDVRVRGPAGYCVDQSASSASRGFAILAGCALLSDRAAMMPDRSGLLTVQFGEPGSALVAQDPAALADYLRSDPGQALLASGPDGVEVGEVHMGDNLVILRFQDRAGAPVPGTTPFIWRGFTDIGGRLVTVSALSYSRAPLQRDAGRTLLELALNALGKANRPDAAPS